MKNIIVKMAILVGFISLSSYAIKPKSIEELKEIELRPKTLPIQKLPNEIKQSILEFLVTAPGATKRARLDNAAENIRTFMRISEAFKPFAQDQEIIDWLITELADRYAYGDKIEAAIALGTQGAGQWLQDRLQALSGPADLNNRDAMIKDLSGYLSNAIASNRISAMAFLIHFFPGFDRQINEAFRQAVKNNPALVEKMLSISDLRDRIALDARDADSWTALMDAASYGDERMVEILIKAGANVNLENSTDNTVLMLAVFAVENGKGKLNSVKKLIAAGGIEGINNIDAVSGYTALTSAIEADDVAMVKILLDAGANPNKIINENREEGEEIATALTIAEEYSGTHKNEIIKLLRAAGAHLVF